MSDVAVEARTVQASVIYMRKTAEKPVSETGGKDGLERRYTGAPDPHEVTIEDGRGRAFTLDGAGFELVDHPTAMRDFYDPVELERVYYPEMQGLIAARTGARRVHIFDHTLRHSDEAVRLERKIREPVRSVHNDYTEWSGPNRVREVLPDEADALLQRRFAIVQVWRATNTPIERNPLAIVDARSIAPEDFIPAERRFPHRVGEIYMFQHNADHRWTWFDRMRRDEALVFKVYDSEKDGRARWGAHTSFTDPATRADAPPRESIEIRAFAFF
ncbi:MAG TPA: CmcJ/NvfI family oxidoreductase [Caulobacteraceae bacterium]|jgi:hypothetical protein|nr:CmcJ/NvfI family oxidoreductase [Caulobacteraceae bacterium]